MNLVYILVVIYGIFYYEGYVNLNLVIIKLFYEVLKIYLENIFIDYVDIWVWGNSGYFIDGKGVYVLDKNVSSFFDF